MLLSDFHCHTKYSFDSEAEPEELVLSAISKDLKIIAITDHADVDCEDCGLYLDFSFHGRKECILDLKEKYKQKLKILYGIEIGQPYSRPEFSENFIRSSGFDFVLGSVHNLKNVPDFCFLNYKDMPGSMMENLYRRYLADNMKLAEIDYINSIGHLSYPMRYISLAGEEFEISTLYPEYEKLFKAIVKNGKVIEINTSTIRKGFDFTMPSEELLDIYKSVGGKYVTVGSDAHTVNDIGANIENGIQLAEKIGLSVLLELSK